MSEGPNAAVLAAAQASPARTDEVTLAKLREAVAYVRDLEKIKSDYETALKETNIKLQEQKFKILPELLDGAQVPDITIAAEGNLPAVTAKVKNFFYANIAADWEEEKRAEAFQYLDDAGHGDLIKTEVVVSFAREDRQAAIDFVDLVKSKGLYAEVRQNVHFKTLTKWLQEMVEKHKILPNLEVIGGKLGRVVELKEKG